MASPSPAPADGGPDPKAKVRFIVENEGIIDSRSAHTILDILRNYTADAAAGGVFLRSCGGDEPGVTRVDLAAIRSPEIIDMIYNIVDARRAMLDRPAAFSL